MVLSMCRFTYSAGTVVRSAHGAGIRTAIGTLLSSIIKRGQLRVQLSRLQNGKYTSNCKLQFEYFRTSDVHL